MFRKKYSTKAENPNPKSHNSGLDSEICPNHPDLILLRDAAADERNAIALYLRAGFETCLTELFFDVAEDEMQHYLEIMRCISMLDPIQAEMLKEQDLAMLTPVRPYPCQKTKWSECVMGKPENKCPCDTGDIEITPPSKRDLPTIDYLTQALAGELHAANKYQTYMDEAQNRCVKELFCYLMNSEKEHIAEFTAALFRITHEPLPEEIE